MSHNIGIHEIKSSGRHRQDLGAIDALAESIRVTGLLHPIVITPSKELIAGERRMAAVKLLGWETIPATVVTNLETACAKLLAERDENTCRKDFTILEAVALGEDLESLEKPKAKERQESGTSSDRKSGGRGKKKPSGKLPEGNGDTRDKVGAAVGLSGRQYEKAKAVADAAKKSPRKYGDLANEMNRTGKVNGAYKKLKRIIAVEQIQSEPEPMPTGPFRVIVIDPPWKYDNREDDATHRASNPYPSMSVEEISAMPIGSLAETDCILWLWTTNAHLPKSFAVIESWGFTYKTILTWVKDKMGTGDWLRGRTEHCLMCVKGKPVVSLTNHTTAIEGPLRQHSRKPDEFYKMVESLCPGSKCELFSREMRDGWIRHGNEKELLSGER